MEKFNLNFSGGDNIIKSICWILSVLSWLLLIITGWISLKWLHDPTAIVWTIHRMNNPKIFGIHTGIYFPIQMQVSFIYIVFIFTMIVALAGFIIYFVKSTFKKDDSVYGGMMGPFSRYHFFPLLCVSALFIIGECSDNPTPKNNAHHGKDMLISSMIFTILGLCSLIFIYIMTDLNTDWYILLTLKKGTYSCFITLLWYNFCYLIYELRAIDTFKDQLNWIKGCGIAFSIIFGLGALAFSFVFKDLVISGLTAFIYAGLTTYFFTLEKANRDLYNKAADGIIDIIMMVLSIVLFVLLIILFREQCLKS
jgi:hypothetical protein